MKIIKKTEELEQLNEEITALYKELLEKLQNGELNGRSVDYIIVDNKLGFKYHDETEYEWVTVDAQLPNEVVQEIEKIKNKADKKELDEYLLKADYNVKAIDTEDILELFNY